MFEAHHSALYAYVYKKCGDSFLAEEIVQQTFIRYWQQRGVEETPDPAYLLFVIAKGRLIDHWRKNEILVSTDPVVLPDSVVADDVLDEKYSAQHFNSLVREAAETLPERQKQIFEMDYYSHMSGDEIACTLNISRKTVSNLLIKARHHVRSRVALQFAVLLCSLF